MQYQEDTWEFGQTFHDIRKNRNIPLKQVADEEVSVSQLSRFERGESDLSVTKFMRALANMKVEIGEFVDVMYHHQRSENIAFMTQLVPLEYKRDIDGFRRLFEEQKAKYAANPSVYQYHLNMILAQSFICKCDETIPFPPEYLDEVADYLFSVEQWRIYELILIGNLYLFFEIPLLHRMGQEIYHKSKETGENQKLAVVVLLNIFETCIQRRETEYADYYREHLPEFLEDETKLYERNIYHFLLGLYEYQTGQREHGMERMQQAITVYEWLGCENLANNYRTDCRKYTEKL